MTRWFDVFFNFGFSYRIMCASQQHRNIIFKRFNNSLQIILLLFSAQNALFYLNRKWSCDALPDRESVLSKDFPENSATNFTVSSNQGFLGDVVFQIIGNTNTCQYKPHLRNCRQSQFLMHHEHSSSR